MRKRIHKAKAKLIREKKKKNRESSANQHILMLSLIALYCLPVDGYGTVGKNADHRSILSIVLHVR